MILNLIFKPLRAAVICAVVLPGACSLMAQGNAAAKPATVAMFQGQNKLKEEDLKAKAAKLQLDAEAFNKCLDSGKYAGKVKQDQNEGLRLGVGGTPALFINGRFLSGALPVQDVAKIIDEEIQKNARQTARAAAANTDGALSSSFAGKH